MSRVILVLILITGCAHTGAELAEREQQWIAEGRVGSQECAVSPLGPTVEPPRVLNSPEVQRALVRNYPHGIISSGEQLRTMICFQLGADGAVEDYFVHRSTGRTEVDLAAMHVASVFRFSAAYVEGEPSSFMVSLPVEFSAAWSGSDGSSAS